MLRERARPVDRVTELHRGLIKDMFDTMGEASGVGLAGPQVGVAERIFVYRDEDELGVVINPAIVSRSTGTELDEEGCLSIPGLYYEVERAAEVRIEGIQADGAPLTIEAEEFLARIFQHEIDHLDGVLFIDHLAEADRKDALRRLRDRALGLPERPSSGPSTEGADQQGAL